MKATELMTMISAGSRPVIQINDNPVVIDGETYENGSIAYGYFSSGQRAKIVSMIKQQSDLWKVTVDMSDFFEHNCAVDENVHYGPDENRLYHWRQRRKRITPNQSLS
jgi:hypothetical protein